MEQLTNTVNLLNHQHGIVAEQIYLIFQAAYKTEASLIRVETFPPLLRTVHDLQAATSKFFGYQQATRLVGVIEIEERAGKLSIESLAVTPELFGKGIGKRLVTHVLDLFKAESAAVQTASANKPAIGLYRKLGFSIEKSWGSKEGIKLVQLQKFHKLPPLE